MRIKTIKKRINEQILTKNFPKPMKDKFSDIGNTLHKVRK